MRRRDWDYSVITAMGVSGLYTAVSGVLADFFGFPQFFLHRYAGYLCTLLASVHLALNWPRVVAYTRHRWRGKRAVTKRPRRGAVGLRLGRRGFLATLLAAAVGFLFGWSLPGMRGDDEAPDRVYHTWSTPGGVGWGRWKGWGTRPQQYKRYDDVPTVSLPDPKGFQGLSFEEVLRRRRSRRAFTDEPLSVEELSRLLYAAQGITEPRRGFRAVPSAGALYPIEVYVVAHQVTGLTAGVYHYAVETHALELLRSGDFRAAVVAASLGQEMVGRAPACLVLTAIFQRTRWRYRERAYRYVLMEAGHAGQNIYLAATSMGLGTCAVGAFLDGAFNELLGLDGREETTLYVFPVGKVD